MTTNTRAKERTAWMSVGVLLLAAASSALAQERGCVELKTVAEVEQEYLNDQGQKATRLVPAEKVVPGNEVLWTITARNVCDKPVADVVIANPVPEHMTFVAGSAVGVGTDIQYSLDGKAFAPPASLTVREADGKSRTARPNEYRAVRWTYKAAFAAGTTAFVRYRALVK
jgi:uncharacterized repeat protein (TIGR01451 family)